MSLSDASPSIIENIRRHTIAIQPKGILKQQNSPRRERLLKLYQYIKIIFPHVGLVLLLVIYTVVGAGLFHIIELPHEKRVRNAALVEISVAHDTFAAELWNISREEGVTEARWKVEMDDRLMELEEKLYTAFSNKFLSIDDLKNQTTTIWTFPAAIFFATTIITTIGYGHVVPVTTTGRIICIVFGLFGIPLMLITIADVGKFLSDLITFIYRAYRRFKLEIKNRSKQLPKLRHHEANGTREADKDASDGKDDEVRIPVWMVLLFLTCYTAFGGFLFTLLEGWEYFEAFYFCFITMATIGFGDIVPSRQMYMFFTMIYIVIGLAITTMCIDLAGTEYIRKIHYFGTKLDTAKDVVGGAMVHGLHAGQDFMEQMKTAVADGRIPLDVRVLASLKRRNSSLSPEMAEQLANMPLGDSFSDQLMLHLYPELADRNNALTNILWEPLSPEVRKILKPNIKVMPDEIDETDAMVLENKVFEKPLFRPDGTLYAAVTGHITTHQHKPIWRSKEGVYELPIFIAPFLLEESDV